MRSLTDDEIDRVSHAIAVDGPAQHEDAIAAVAKVAAAAGAPTGVIGALTDRGAPAVLRSRAWGRAAAAIRRCRTNPEVALVA
jgi:hypothetical protein